MSSLVSYLQDISALAFILLGIVTGITWLRHREQSLGYLALAIILLALVSGLGQLQSLLPIHIPVLTQVDLILFMGSAYALFLYRSSLIPLSRRWHVVVLLSMAAASGFYLVVSALTTSPAWVFGSVVALVLLWCAAVGEPIVRFWLVARSLPTVQAWRLRSLSLGFGALVLILVLAVSVGSFSRTPLVQVVVELVAIAIVPLLYASFSPPEWLRRQWRSADEEGLRAFMEELLVADDRDALSSRALNWATRLTGGESAVLFDSQGATTAVNGLQPKQVAEVRAQLPQLQRGVNRLALGGAERNGLMLPVAGLTGRGTLVVLAGPFTPGVGTDETNRVQQLMSAFVTAIDRRHLIVQLEETNAALRDANLHKSVFLANMSHELRTPLNAIIGFSELLTDARDGQFDDATRKRFLNQILTSGKHLLGLINDILDLSKVEAGQMELRLQTVSIAETVDQVVRTVEPLIAKKSIRMETDVASAGDLLADAGKLKQMLLNLVSNAIKFTPEGGTVTIGARRFEESVEIWVADNGIGIAEKDQKEIFQEFHQVDPGPGRKHEGTGLGLALTKRFAVLHGGDVRVASGLGKGSVFTLTLPLRGLPAEKKPVPTPLPATKANGSGPLVLVVEDDPAAAELITRQLTSAGYRTHLARTGTEAVAKARELQPAAITLDIILPELDGWEVMNRLKSDESTSGIPVLIVSVVDNPELGVSLGAIDYLVKPVDANALVRRLSRLNIKPADPAGQIRVLVVDDNAANREWMTRALKPAGFKVTTADGGRAAIQIAKSQKPDLVLLDLMMPEVTGFDVVEALRSDPSTRDTPIMVVTAATLTEEDKKRLNGWVSQVLSRASLASSTLVEQLKRVVVERNGQNGHDGHR